MASQWYADQERNQLRVSAAVLAVAVPSYVAFLLIPQKRLALIMLVPFTLATNFFVAARVSLIPPLQRLASPISPTCD